MFSEDDILQRSRLLLGDKVMERMKQTSVIVFGIGGVGSWCAEALIRTGIGNITLVDNDTVSVSNINRQLPATTLTVDRHKTEVLAERLADINPYAQINVIDTFFDSTNAHTFNLEAYDYVIDAIDSLASKVLLIERATSQRHATLFSSMGAALKLSAQNIRVAEFSKVKGCPLARALRQKFRRADKWPRRKFKCVYSEELLQNATTSEESCDYKAAINGSLIHITGTFGFNLASLVIEDIVKKTLKS